MVSIKVKYRHSTTEGREGIIFFQVVSERVARCYFPGYKVFNEEWDVKKSSLIITAKSERWLYLLSIRKRIKWDLDRFNRIISELSLKKDRFTADEVVEEFSMRQNEQSFFHFMETVILRLRELGKQRTSEAYMTALNSFRRFRNDEDIVLDEFDSDIMESYQAYLRAKGLIPNSISFHLRILRAVYNRAVEKGITVDKKPFRHVYTGVDKTTKRAVDIKTLKKIKEANLEMYPRADYARDMFFLSFFFRGMSFVDMAYLKKSNLSNGQISYRRRKTGQCMTVRWTREMQELVDKYPRNDTEYLLPIITNASENHYHQYRSKQYQVNKALKTVAKRIGLKMPLTLYCSRHTWASIAKAKGIPIGVISDGLGHDSERTTQIYLSTLDTNPVDEANALIMRLI